MIIVGTASRSGDSTYEEVLLPSVRAFVEPETVLLRSTDHVSLAQAYNRFIDEVADRDDVEALVLVHDDVRIEDRNLVARIRRAFRDASIGVLGCAGTRNVWSMRYWLGFPGYGVAYDGGGVNDFGPLRGDVDVVDGFLMVLAPSALGTVRFDDQTFTGYHGYDIDFCLSCRAAGLRVRVEPFDVFHLSPGDLSSDGYDEAFVAFERKWHGRLAKPPLRHRHPRVNHARVAGERVVGAFAPGFEELSATVRRSSERLGSKLHLSRRTGSDAARPPSAAPDPASVGVLARCPVCTAPIAASAEVTVEPTVARCGSCGLGITIPPPHAEIESADLFDDRYSSGSRSQQPLRERDAAQRLAWLETLVPDGILLEVGCSTGEFLAAADADGYETYGVEPSRWAAKRADAKGVAVTLGVLEDWIRGNTEFTVDAVVMFHVLEHVADPVELLSAARSLLAPGGRLLVEVPNYGSRGAIEEGVDWLALDTRYHHVHFTPIALELALNRAGFGSTSLSELTFRPYSPAQWWRGRRAAARIAGHRSPAPDLLRAVASTKERGS